MVHRTDLTDYLTYLESRGRSPYTVRSYRLGLEHFYAWLDTHELALGDVSRQIVEAYLDDLRISPKGGAVRASPERAGQVNPATRKAYPNPERKASTINHRLSVLAAFFDFLIRRDEGDPSARWSNRGNPVRPAGLPLAGHGMTGRDVPKRNRRSELRMRVPRDLPKDIDRELAEKVIDTAVSWRDKALLTLLYRSGQRIGDWCDGRGHGVLGMRLSDLDQAGRTIVVRLKGPRHEHRVPVTEDFWALFENYVSTERGDVDTDAAWVGLRKATGRPLTYTAFEASVRYIGKKLGANISAHMFRHTVARTVVEVAGIKTAQELLGHAHITTTADTYARVDMPALLDAVNKARCVTRVECPGAPSATTPSRYVFSYDPDTLAELDLIADPSDPADADTR